MRFILFVEGDTEREVLPALLKRAVEPELGKAVRVQPVNFHGWANLWRDVRQKADFYLRGPGHSPEVIAVVSILDLYGPDIYPDRLKTTRERMEWAKAEVEKEIAHPRFRQFFAVHELEAWLLAQPEIFPPELRKDIHALSSKPEEVNFNRPPKRQLNALYEQRLKRGYLPRVDGAKLFRLVNPEIIRSKCPLFREMTAELIRLVSNPGGKAGE